MTDGSPWGGRLSWTVTFAVINYADVKAHFAYSTEIDEQLLSKTHFLKASVFIFRNLSSRTHIFGPTFATSAPSSTF